MTKTPPDFFMCEECENQTVPNPYPDTTICEVVCVKCECIHEIEWVDDTVYTH